MRYTEIFKYLFFQSYYVGETRCIEQAGLGDEFDPSKLVCGGCSDVAQAQVMHLDTIKLHTQLIVVFNFSGLCH